MQKLKEYFTKREDVVLAFLFGSRAKERAITDSDWDIAIYFKSEVKPVEWEEYGREYPEEDRVRNDCVDILKTDKVDLVVLNRAPANVAEAAIRGIPLVIKNRWLLLEFMLVITGLAEDFRLFAKDYDKIYWRSQSLTELDAHSLTRRTEFLNSELDVIQKIAEMSQLDYQNDDTKRRVVERSIENIMNAVIDISKIILASQKKPIPQTYREIIQYASFSLTMPETEANELASHASLRNILAHEYLDLRWKEIESFLRNTEIIIKFINAAKKFVEGN